jgi:hypothetical protein
MGPQPLEQSAAKQASDESKRMGKGFEGKGGGGAPVQLTVD